MVWYGMVWYSGDLLYGIAFKADLVPLHKCCEGDLQKVNSEYYKTLKKVKQKYLNSVYLSFSSGSKRDSVLTCT